jgi:DNA polymerase IV
VERVILHSDMNNYYASVECMLNPDLKGKAVAVCGSQIERHGIVLAKNQLAKKHGVKTGEVIWQALQKCPDLLVLPPHYDEYLKYSKMAKEIYYRYTDLIEPFGIDECWLDVSGSTHMFGSGYDMAYEIKETIKQELGLTVSIGVSFNKIFAKLGSDMKKPDAVTCITKEGFKEQIWDLPVGELLGVGWATRKKLSKWCIETIGDLAKSDPRMLKFNLGINGVALWQYANGMDISRVRPFDHTTPAKSIGHGITCTSDLKNNFEVLQVITELTQDISTRLRKHALAAMGIQISVRDCNLFFKEYQARLDHTTQSAKEISGSAYELFKLRYGWEYAIRSITVRAISLVPVYSPEQLDIYVDYEKRARTERLELAIENIRKRYGKDAIRLALVMDGLKMPGGDTTEVMTLPSPMYK